MRDILLFSIVFGVIPFALASPQTAVYLWTWISYMNPHKLAWGAAQFFPFAQVAAIVMFLSIIINSKTLRRPIVNWTTVIWVLLLLWMIVTTSYALFPEDAQYQLEKVLKIQVIVFVIMLVIRDQASINKLVWVTFLSVGFFGIKGGIFVLLTGGQGRVWGPTGTFIADNNHLAVALLMITPLGYYLAQTVDRIWIKRMLYTFLVLIFFSIIASYSRGAFIAIAAVLFYFWWLSKSKLRLLIPLVLMIPLVFAFMPEKYSERIDTLRNFQEDKSAMGRINAWRYSINVASDRLTGAGFESWRSEAFYVWAPDPDSVHAAHSIYFGFLADHGWPGLIMFLLILMLSWRRANRIINLSKDNEDLKWAYELSRMIKLSLVAYFAGGAFLSLGYFDLPWQLIATLLLVESVITEKDPVEAIGEEGQIEKADPPPGLSASS